MDAVYTTEALSTGAGRDGRSVVKDSDLNFTMTAPKAVSYTHLTLPTILLV